MSIRVFKPGPDWKKHVPELLDAVKECQPRDTLMVEDDCHVYGYPHIAAPINIVGKFIVHDASEILIGPSLKEPQYATGCNVRPVAEGDGSVVYTPAPTFQPIAKVGHHVFVWSEDAITGVIPHAGPQSIQCPGECHRVVDVESESRGDARIWTDGPMLDSMVRNPRLLVVDLTAWRGLQHNIEIVGVDRTSGRCAVFQGLPEATITIRTEKAGDVAFHCPDLRLIADIRGQVDESNHYGVVIGPWCKDFRIVGRGYGCRHVQTTSGLPITVAGKQVQCGTPNGFVTMDVVGRYNSPLDTHASGRHIVYDRCSVTILATKINFGGVGIKVRARDTLIKDCVIRGTFPTTAGTIGIESWATGCRYSDVTFRTLWMPVKTSGPGSIIAGV